MTIEQANNMYLKTANSFLSNEAIECFHQAKEINRLFSSASFQLGQEMNQIAQQIFNFQRIVSSAIMQLVHMTQQLAEAINPVIISIGQQTLDFSRAFSPIVNHLVNTIDTNHFNIKRFSTTIMELDDTSDFWEYFDDNKIEISEIEKYEIEKIAEDIVSSPLNWEQKLINIYGKIKEKHPVSAKILLLILSTLTAILINVASSAIFETINQTKLREQPSTTSTIITTIEINQMIYVIDEVPYYFEVEFTNNRTGETVSGWLSKKSVKPYLKESTESPLREEYTNE